MINKRLFDRYSINTNKDLKIKNLCPRPKDTILIDKLGSCYACECTSWLPQSIGNLQIKTLEEIIGNLNKATQNAVDLIKELLASDSQLCDDGCECRTSLELAVWSNPETIDPKIKEALSPLFE